MAVLGAAALTDVLDGWFARRWHAVSHVGAVLDGVADKIFAAEVVSALVHSRRLAPELVTPLFVREAGEAILAVAFLAHPALARAWLLHMNAGRAGKATTVLQVCSCLAAQSGWRRASRVLAWATGIMGATSVVSYLRRTLAYARAAGLERT